MPGSIQYLAVVRLISIQLCRFLLTLETIDSTCSKLVDTMMNFLNAENIASNSFLSSKEIDHLHREVKSRGWCDGLIRFLSCLSLERVSSLSYLIGAKHIGWKLFLDFSKLKRVLIIDTTLGNITRFLAPRCKKVYVVNPDYRILECISVRLKEEGIRNISLIQCSGAYNFPFRDKFFDLIVLHHIENIYHFSVSDSFSRKAKAKWLFKEIERMIHTSGSVFISFMNKYGYHRVLGRITDGREKYLPSKGKMDFSSFQVRRALKKAGLENIRSYSVYPSLSDLRELFDIGTTKDVRDVQGKRQLLREYLFRRGIFSPAYIFIASKRTYTNFLGRLIKNSVIGKKRYRISRYLIGGDHVILCVNFNGEQGQDGVIIRMPLTDTATTRCINNMTALKNVRLTNHRISSLVPEPLEEGSYEEQPFFIEKKLNGIAIDEYGETFAKCFPIVLSFFTDFHRKTAQHYKVDDAIFERFFLGYLKELKKVSNKASLPNGHLYELYFKKQLYDKELPIVMEHGDLKLENILFDPKTNSIKGIIDWDLSKQEGMPLLDILHLLASRRRVIHKRKLIEVIKDVMIPLNFDDWEKEVLFRYMDCLGINRSLLACFSILYWIHHIEKRIRGEIIKTHSSWIERNISEPHRLISSLYFQKK